MQPLLLLHGAIGASAQLKSLAEQLSSTFKIHTFDFAGHGGKEGTEAPFSMANFANEVLAFMEQEKLDKVSIFGYSMGGYVGMYLAKHYPDKVEKVVTLATKYHWDETTAAREVQMLNPEKIEQKVPAFAEALKNMHAPNDWKQLMKQTADMMLALGNDNPLKLTDYVSISTPAMILLGDRDKMVTLDETLAVYKALPNAQLGVIPNTPHPIEQVDAELLSVLIKRFLV
ncbi:MAG: alpha/beta hydrolase [Flavipsychrobacter sp.]|jgi:pimeloyl-ACP methyl ester carboxylesterase|nr:alpha/beta hydrolase [Flavipsychrobacter sp.]